MIRLYDYGVLYTAIFQFTLSDQSLKRTQQDRKVIWVSFNDKFMKINNTERKKNDAARPQCSSRDGHFFPWLYLPVQR